MTRGYPILAVLLSLGCGNNNTPLDSGAIGGPTGIVPSGDFVCEAVDPLVPVAHTTTPSVGTFDGRNVGYSIPANPRAVVVYFHGTGGGIDQLLWTPFTELLTVLEANNVGFMGTESADRGDQATWAGQDTIAGNVDLDFIDRWRDELIATTALAKDTPLILMGFSNGGSMAATAGVALKQAGWPIAGVSSHNAGGSSDNSRLKVPILFSSTENDDPGFLESAHERALDDGVDSTLFSGVEEPLESFRFVRIGNSYDAQTSEGVFDELVAFGMIDVNGVRLTNINNTPATFNMYTNNATVGAGPSLVVSELKQVWQMHRFNAQYAVEECEWIGATVRAIE